MASLPEPFTAALERMVRQYEEQGRISHSQINELLPWEDVSSWHLEVLFDSLAEQGIQVVEDDPRA